MTPLVVMAITRVQYPVVDETDWLYQEIGKRIRQARIAAGMTQHALAEQSDLARSSVTNIESGNQQAPVHVLWRIAGAVGVSIRTLLPDAPPSGESLADVRLPDDVPAATRVALLRIASEQIPRTSR